MRVALVGPDQEENLSLRYLLSALKAAGHEAVLAQFDTAEDFQKVVAVAKGADLVGLSMCYQVRAREFLAAALKAERPGRPVVAGGHYASCAAKDLLALHPELDAILVGEGERALVELAALEEFSAKDFATIPGLVFREGDEVVSVPPRPAVEELDTLTWPDRTGPARLMSGVPTAYLMGSRGCLSACDYCCISALHRLAPGKRFRQRSVSDIAGEMADLYHHRGVRQFIFHDDNFLVPDKAANLERIDALDRAIRGHRMRRLGLALKCRPGDVDRDVFLRLREMGLIRVFLGIESGSAAGLRSIGRHRQAVEDEHRALDICHDLGISVQYTIILFHPEASLASMREDLAFVRRHAHFPMSYCRAEIYSGTPLEARMIQAGRSYGDYLGRAYNYSDPLAALAWEASSDLLLERCFTQTNIQGRIIRLDHQVAVLRHFYDNPSIDELSDDFAAFESRVNLDTAALMGEIFEACEAHPEASSPALRVWLDDITARERVARATFEDEACRLREAMSAQYEGLIEHARAGSSAPRAQRLPLHAAAVVLAMSMMNCNQSGTSEMAPSPLDASRARDANPKDQNGMNEMAPPPVDASTRKDTRVFLDQGGMFEAPPPPVDAPVVPLDASKDTKTTPDTRDSGSIDAGSDGGKVDGGTADGSSDGAPNDGGDARKPDARVYVDQGGMFEAPPPPVDANKG
jgi:radical SAM superfamily enzyme YgiQ (UPF0313 family)